MRFRLVVDQACPQTERDAISDRRLQLWYAEAVKTAKTVVWNGPMGVFENPILAEGTIAVAKLWLRPMQLPLSVVVTSAAAVNQLGFADKMSHISTGGGASLEFLEGKRASGRGSSRRNK